MITIRCEIRCYCGQMMPWWPDLQGVYDNGTCEYGKCVQCIDREADVICAKTGQARNSRNCSRCGEPGHYVTTCEFRERTAEYANRYGQ